MHKLLYIVLLFFCISLFSCSIAKQNASHKSSKLYKEQKMKVKAKDSILQPPIYDNNTNKKSSVDTTYILLSDTQIENVLKELKPKMDGLSPEVKTIMSTLAGATLALLTQLFIFSLGKKSDTDKSKLELRSEERRLSELLVGYYKELAYLKASTNYWYRFYFISRDIDSWNRSELFRDRIVECKRKINETTSEYTKTVTHFTHLIKYKAELLLLLDKIRSATFLDSDSSDFNSITDTNILHSESQSEVKRLKEEYLKMERFFDDIHSIMGDT